MKIMIYSDNHFCEKFSIISKMGNKYTLRLENQIKSLNWAEDLAYHRGCQYVICAGDFFDKPNCAICNDALRYFTDIKNVWSGFRTCYTDHVDFSETLVDKAKLPALRELYSKDSEKSEAKLETLSKKYGYSFDKPLQFSFSYYENLLDSEDPVEHYFAQRWFQYLNALKFIAPKVKMGHESPLEHSILTFKIKNCSRSSIDSSSDHISVAASMA